MLLVACAEMPAAPPQPELLFHDRLFGAPTERIDPDDVFALSEPMRRYLSTEIAGHLRSKGRQQALADALYQRQQLKLEYDATTTRNAARAFEARAGNCLSLVIMTAAFAKELGLRVEYQSAFLEETWSRSGDLYLRSGHVNLTLGPRMRDLHTGVDTRLTTIDFLPPEEVRGLRTRAVDEATVVAMYMNNHAAEALVQGRLDDAYAWAREAMRQSPLFFSAYNTLGVVYLRHGNLDQAEQAFRHVLAREPANPRVMANLVQVLDLGNRVAEADALRQQLVRIEPYPPFHFFNLGLAAMESNDFRAARNWFAKEVDRADYNHEFHFWLALANFRLGEIDQARKHMALALENSTTRRDHDLYAAKLAWIRLHSQH